MYGKVSKTYLENGDGICHKGVGGRVRKYDWKCIQTQNIFVHHKNSSFFFVKPCLTFKCNFLASDMGMR